jgi:hypothetical protein
MFHLSQTPGTEGLALEFFLNRVPNEVLMGTLEAADRAASRRCVHLPPLLAAFREELGRSFPAAAGMSALRGCCTKAYNEAAQMLPNQKKLGDPLDVLTPLFVRAWLPLPFPPYSRALLSNCPPPFDAGARV